MLNIRIGALHVTREGKGIRFTIPTPHSSIILTQDEARQLLNMLVREFRTKTRTCARCGYVMKVDLQTCAKCGADNGER